MTSTETEVRPKPSSGDTDEPVFHYVKKGEIVESAVTGKVVEALCGATFPVTRQPKPGAKVCPACADLYANKLLGG